MRGARLLSDQQGRVFSQHEFDAFAVKLFAELREEQRQYAPTTQPTYPGGGATIQIDTALRFPVMISRALTDLVYSRFVADRILNRGTAAQVASGAVVFRRSEGIFMDRLPEQVGVRAEWPRSGETPTGWFAALAQKRGLEVPISDEAKRRFDTTELAKAQRKLANSIVRDTDQLAMSALMNDAAVQTYSTSGAWSVGGTDKIADIQAMRSKINNLDLGYVADTLVINPTQETQLLLDANIRALLPREVTAANPLANSVISGQAVPLLGLRQILVTNQIAAGTMIMLNSGVVGSIADELPAADEGYTGYDPGAGQSPLFVKTYREENTDESIVRGARFPAIWISEPKAAVVATGA